MVNREISQIKLIEEILAEKLSEVEKLFGEIRDKLFECSHEAAKADGNNWQKAEALFKLAKNTDELRLTIPKLSEGQQSESEIEDSLSSETIREFLPQSADSKIAASTTSKTTRKKKDDYPKYSIRGDLFVKTGLSRDRRSLYEHVVPQKVFDQIINRLTELSKSKRNFTVDDVQKSLEHPSYQLYIVLSFLRSREVLIIPRRGVYSFKSAKTFAGDATTIWNELKAS